MSGNIFVCLNSGVLLDAVGATGVLLNLLQGTEQFPPQGMIQP